jgi:hypothetical protein
MFRGGWLCGGVRYEIEGEPVVVAHCHCTDCQRLSEVHALFGGESECLGERVENGKGPVRRS